MSLEVRSRFYFGHSVSSINNAIDFDEGGSELQATLNSSDFTFEQFADEIKRVMDLAGALTYTVTVNRTTRIITIAATGVFTLRITSGTRFGTTAFALAGFSGADVSGSATYDGNNVSGSVFSPQFFLQDFLAKDDNSEAVQARINESSSGKIEVIQFGSRQFVEMNIRWITNKSPTGNDLIQLDVNALANARTFMNDVVLKRPIEFMEDVADLSTFLKLQLERSPTSRNGTGFRLRERFDIPAPGYFDTGPLQFRVLT